MSPPAQPQDAAPQAAGKATPDEKAQINELFKLMVQSEDKVVADFNRLYEAPFPNTSTVAKSPFKTVVQITDSKDFTDAIDCYDMMLERLQILESSGKFEATYQQYSVETAVTAFRD